MRCMRSDAVLGRRTRSPGCCAVQVQRSLLPPLLDIQCASWPRAMRMAHCLVTMRDCTGEGSRDQCGRCPAELCQGPCAQRTKPARSHEQRPHSTPHRACSCRRTWQRAPAGRPRGPRAPPPARRRPPPAGSATPRAPAGARVQPCSPSGLQSPGMACVEARRACSQAHARGPVRCSPCHGWHAGQAHDMRIASHLSGVRARQRGGAALRVIMGTPNRPARY